MEPLTPARLHIPPDPMSALRPSIPVKLITINKEMNVLQQSLRDQSAINKAKLANIATFFIRHERMF